MRQLRHQAGLRPVLVRVALGAFLLYIGWNAFHLFRGQLPPSIWQSVTGLPAPTTGCLRSLRSFAEGDLQGGILYNPFCLPFLLLLGLSGLSLGRAYARSGTRRWQLPRQLELAWMLALAGAWATKFALGPAYW